ncbi:pantetheine-phosphate adenylyltransferase [Pelagicoccus mobilis]|uniref:Phosphopantetheine adenylyltransferase n=1 Tax=Pelagicoccus mobilis TaxID=415221 RepID=A0A934S027_9BACT|nr:pantetheine-phosphate adenylyltransferase [Pelagicoccus mobilis]MBK1879821.1 pantetheine-phosphate adenylyltransferase [Pelagicoccus mobilis]
MRICIYPGTFDPITHGHLDILERACRMFDKVIVAVAENAGKNPFFSQQERLALVESNLANTPNASATSFNGLLVDFAKQQGAIAIIRGLRAVSDFEYEFQMALMNRHLEHDIETILLMTGEGNNYTSSSLVKQVARYGADISKFVPKNVNEALKAKLDS